MENEEQRMKNEKNQPQNSGGFCFKNYQHKRLVGGFGNGIMNPYEKRIPETTLLGDDNFIIRHAFDLSGRVQHELYD